MVKTFRLKWWQLLFVAVLLGLTLAVRLYRLDTLQFDSDYGRDSLFAWRIVHEKPTLLGAQASVGGFYLGPFYFYALALLYALVGPIPEAIMIAFGVLNLVTAWLGFRWLTTRVNLTAGLIFLLLFSTQSLMIVSSRGATHVPMLPFVTVLVMVTLTRVLEKPTPLRHFLSGLALGLFLHVHFSSLLLFPGYFLIVAALTPGNWLTRLKALSLQVAGVIFMLLPLIAFDVRHQFLTSRAFLNYILQVVQGENVRENIPPWTLMEKIANYLLFLGPRRWLQVAALLLSGGSLWQLWPRLASPQRRLSLVLSFLTVSVFILILLYPGYLFLYYLVVPGMLLLLTVSALLAQLRLRWIGLIIALLICVGQAQMLPQLYLPQFRTVTTLTKIVGLIENDLQQQGQPPFAIYKDSSDRLTGLGYEYRFLLTRDGFVPVSEFDYSQARVLYIIREEGSADPLQLGGHELGQFQPKAARLVGTLVVPKREVSVFALSR